MFPLLISDTGFQKNTGSMYDMDENCTMKRRENGRYNVRVKNGKGVVIAKADNIPFHEAVALIENTMYQEDDNGQEQSP